MKIKKQKLVAILLASILIAFIPLVAAAPSGTSESAVVEAAKGWIGVKSVHGGDNRSGIDCSHLVFQVYKQAGVKDIVFQTVPNMKNNPYYVNTNSPTPGDIVFWQKDITANNRNYWLISHVGIYIGNEQFIHTSFDTKTVTIESISGVYRDGMPYYAKWAPDGSGTVTQEDPVPAGNNNPNPPVAAFSASPASGNAPLEVSYTDSSTGATSWLWDFGDGSTSTEQNPVHIYPLAGNYNVVLTAGNENGSSSKTLNMIVQGEQVQENTPPVADFYADPASGYAPLSVQFTDLSQGVIGWYWDFGDGTNSTEQSPMHTYSSAGNYAVTLTGNNGNGLSSKTLNIIVQEVQSQENTFPIADFYKYPASEYVPLSVQFTDLSQNVVGWYWDFGDGTNSTEQNPAHTYPLAGNYNVILTVNNGNETASKMSTIGVLEESSSGDSSNGGSSHHSSGGGGSGGSPEPAKNVQVKESLKTFISSGKDVAFNFTKNATCVESIVFRSTKTVGKTTTIVEELKNKSSLVSSLPEGIVYRSFNVWVGNDGYGSSENVENSSVNFKVNTSWVNENNINRSSIVLNVYDGEKKEWEELPVNLTGEDEQFLYLTANVPGYSSFAITGTEEEFNATAPDPVQTAANSTAGSNASIIENSDPEENKMAPGFGIIGGVVSLFCMFLYRIKGR